MLASQVSPIEQMGVPFEQAGTPVTHVAVPVVHVTAPVVQDSVPPAQTGAPTAQSAVVVQAAPGAVMLTVTDMLPEAPAGTGPVKVQTIVPAMPTAGVTHVAPGGGVMPWNVVPGGVVKLIETPFSAQKPATHVPALAQGATPLHATGGEPFL